MATSKIASDPFEETILQRLNNAGHKITTPRRAIVHVLLQQQSHFKAEEILEEAKRMAPHTGRATVYRTLEILETMGMLEQLHLGEGSHSYVLGEQSHHHHLICSQCGKVVEFHGCQIGDLVNTFAAMHRFTVDGHQLEMYGRCWECR